MHRAFVDFGEAVHFKTHKTGGKFAKIDVGWQDEVVSCKCRDVMRKPEGQQKDDIMLAALKGTLGATWRPGRSNKRDSGSGSSATSVNAERKG
eukprot:95789-Amphidinium_carterae.1